MFSNALPLEGAPMLVNRGVHKGDQWKSVEKNPSLGWSWDDLYCVNLECRKSRSYEKRFHSHGPRHSLCILHDGNVVQLSEH